MLNTVLIEVKIGRDKTYPVGIFYNLYTLLRITNEHIEPMPTCMRWHNLYTKIIDKLHASTGFSQNQCC